MVPLPGPLSSTMYGTQSSFCPLDTTKKSRVNLDPIAVVLVGVRERQGKVKTNPFPLLLCHPMVVETIGPTTIKTSSSVRRRFIGME